MISFHYETKFKLNPERTFKSWLKHVILSEQKKVGDINYIFCDDVYLHKINLDYLNHDTFTDIISFDYSIGNVLHGDIFVSVERIADNAKKYNVSFEEELKRVMAHGVLHFCGFKDKTKQEKTTMRSKEDEKIEMFHVEQNKTKQQ
ncbi:rRNA maturation RNase YbeY [Flavobacterium orientale]|uniref:Endoribonuclease YbeY n=1 Tax=Flavobacterium orientale TaxID=1756020 RepID=A0A917DAE7_9FLAO|nr:rRNA maturation RNase YbeY [Flavobacterium orientale]GGD22336.1 endoribonuclease YbeY [Flavobacterium orientale]